MYINMSLVVMRYCS